MNVENVKREQYVLRTYGYTFPHREVNQSTPNLLRHVANGLDEYSEDFVHSIVCKKDDFLDDEKIAASVNFSNSAKSVECVMHAVKFTALENASGTHWQRAFQAAADFFGEHPTFEIYDVISRSTIGEANTVSIEAIYTVD